MIPFWPKNTTVDRAQHVCLWVYIERKPQKMRSNLKQWLSLGRAQDQRLWCDEDTIFYISWCIALNVCNKQKINLKGLVNIRGGFEIGFLNLWILQLLCHRRRRMALMSKRGLRAALRSPNTSTVCYRFYLLLHNITHYQAFSGI